MASDRVLLAIQKELEQFKKIPFAELTAAVESGQGFYGEGEIPAPRREKR